MWIAITILILYLLLAWKNLTAALVVLIVLLPSYGWRLNFWGLPSSLLELLILAFFLIWFLQKDKIAWREELKQLPKAWYLWLLAWLLASVVALKVNWSFGALGIWRAYFLEPMLLLFPLLDLLRTKEKRQYLFFAFACLIIFLSFVAVYQNFTGFNLPVAYNLPNVKRLTSVFSYPNAVALLLAPLWVFLLSYAWQLKIFSKERCFFVFSLLLGAWLIWSTKSEGAILALVLALLVFVFFQLKRLWQKSTMILALGLVFFFSPLLNYFKQAVADLFFPSNSHFTSSLAVRGLQWQETWQMLREHWLFGAGLNGYQTLFAQYHQITWLEIFMYPHNIFLNFWSELGLFGLLVFFGFLFLLISTLRKLWQEKHSLFWPLSLAWLTIFVHGLVDVPYFKNDLSILFFIFLALTVVVSGKSKNDASF